MDIDLKQLRDLMRAMKQLDVKELELETETERVFLRRGPAQGEPTIVAQPMMAAPYAAGGTMPPPAPEPARSPEKAAADTDKADDATFITSPFVGTFYRAPSPDAPNFVDVGTKIAPGQVLCIVEAMKLMNEIEAEVSGEILEVVAENGKPVEFGDPLFKIKKS